MKITFKNGNSVIYEKDEWNDWAFINGFVVIKDENAAWIAMYNATDIFAVELLEGKEIGE